MKLSKIFASVDVKELVVLVDKEFTEEHSLNHYECYDVPERRNVALELSPAEENEVNRLMHIILKKIYNYEYQPNSDK